jgi:exopolysaccharide biosynthesis polyprenyl glycosylphosphotransferase
VAVAARPQQWAEVIHAPALPRPRSRFAAVVILSDVLALAVAVSIAVTRPAPWWAWVFMVAVMSALASTGHYRRRISPSIAEEAGSVLASVTVPVVVLAAIVGGSGAGVLVRGAVLAAALLIAFRAMCYVVLRAARSRGLLMENALIIGAGQVGAKLAEVLQEHPQYGLCPIGFLDSFDDADLPIPVLGTVRSLDVVLAEYGVGRVLIAFGATREPDMVPIVRACDRASVDIHVLPRFFELGFAAKGRDVDDVWGLPLLRLRRAALRPGTWSIKRAFDVVVAGLGLVIVSPVYLALAIAVKLSSPGPVYHRQRRVGQRGGVVEILKFRSMRENSDSDIQWSVVDDDRLTGVGRFMRALSLDELPQLLNVLRGEMSLVGPRPERPFFVNRFKSQVPRYGDRHRVPVGLTGLAQVHGLRGDTSIEERARFDNQYIENWSLWWDLVIMAKTLGAVARHARKHD